MRSCYLLFICLLLNLTFSHAQFSNQKTIRKLIIDENNQKLDSLSSHLIKNCLIANSSCYDLFDFINENLSYGYIFKSDSLLNAYKEVPASQADTLQLALFKWIKARISFLKGDIHEAHRNIEESISTFKFLPDFNQDRYYYKVLLTKVNIHVFDGHFFKAEKILHSILVDLKSFKNAKEDLEFEVKYSLAQIYTFQGKNYESQVLIKELMSVLNDDNHLQYAYILKLISNVLSDKGLYKMALDSIEKSISVIKKNYGKSNDYYTAVIERAYYFNTPERFEMNETLINEAMDYYKASGQNLRYNLTAVTLATLYFSNLLGKSDNRNILAGEILIENVEKIKIKLGENSIRYADALLALAIYMHEYGFYFDDEVPFSDRISKVRSVFKKVLSIHSPSYIFATHMLARYYFYFMPSTVSTKQKAIELYTEVMNNALKRFEIQYPYLNNMEKETLISEVHGYFNEYFKYVRGQTVMSQIDEMLFNYALVYKGYLLKNFHQMQTSVLNSYDQEITEMFSDWKKLRMQYASSITMSEEELEEFNIDLNEIKEEIDDTEVKLFSSDAFANTDYASISPTWENILEVLEPNEVAIEMVKYESEFELPEEQQVCYRAIILDSNRKKPYSLQRCNSRINEERNLSYYTNSIKYRTFDSLSYANFWGFLLVHLNLRFQKIYFAPDGIYHKMNPISIYIPFLNGFVIDFMVRSEFHIVTSTSEILELKRKKHQKPDGGAYLFGNPKFGYGDKSIDFSMPKSLSREFDLNNIKSLPGAELEVDILDSLLSEHNFITKKYVGDEATETSLKAIDSPGLLHIASHGFFLDDINDKGQINLPFENDKMLTYPLLRSGLLLAKDEGSNDDGILSAEEAQNLNLYNTDLVTLSACETGLGNLKNGEGVYGLQRSLRFAGAESLLMSLWQVNDVVTREFMNEFYRLWLNGLSKNRAWIDAQILIKKRYDHPYYWSGFVLIGH